MVSIAKGPNPSTVLKIAMLDVMNTVMAVPHVPKRKADQIRRGKMAYR